MGRHVARGGQVDPASLRHVMRPRATATSPTQRAAEDDVNDLLREALMSVLARCIACRIAAPDVVVGLCDACAEHYAPGEPRATVCGMNPHNPPTYATPTDAPRAAAEAIAALSALVAIDPTLAPAAARAIGEIRAKYPEVSVGPIDPDPG